MAGKSKDDKTEWHSIENWLERHKTLSIGLTLLLFFILLNSFDSPTQNDVDSNSVSQTSQQEVQETEPTEEQVPAERQARGTKATLGAGMFTAGDDIEPGLYDITTTSGQNGNLFVNDGASVNEILDASGDFGVPKVRAEISNGDSIEISGLSNVVFTPVTAKFVTDYKKTTLYTGTFIVGQDIGEGRYEVAPLGSGSGNFFVNDGAKVNEILDRSGDFGVPSVTVNLSRGDTIQISGFAEATFTPTD